MELHDVIVEALDCVQPTAPVRWSMAMLCLRTRSVLDAYARQLVHLQ